MHAVGAESIVNCNLLSSNLSIPAKLQCIEEVEELVELLGDDSCAEARVYLADWVAIYLA